MAKVLIVDDSRTETQRLAGILEKNGYTVICADSGERGIELARQTQPDLVLMDIVMPGINGFQATRELARAGETGHIPIIIVTMKDQHIDRVWGARQGARAYLAKPVAEKELLNAIQQVIG